MKTKILFLSINFLVIGIFIGLVTGQFYKIDFIQILIRRPNPTPTISPNITPEPSQQSFDCTQCQTSDFKNYFYHRIILFGEDENKSPLLFKFQLSRKQTSRNEYDHFYNLTLFKRNETIKEDDVFKNTSDQVALNKLFTNFKISKNSGQTTEETYKFDAKIENEIYTITIDGIQGDFVVKDTNDYIRIMSEGSATIEQGGKTYKTRALVDRILSNDYTKSIFFEGREKLSHVTHSIALWDETSEFYLIDFTQSNSPDLPYESHKWVIHKNKDGYTNKIFDGELDFVQNEFGFPEGWDINLKDLNNTQINLTATDYFGGGYDMGLLKGTIKDATDQIKSTKGYFVYMNENPK
ncbi:hypothetical protein KBD45_01685 [Candidatus Dojkabacteria bacterium]|nr:hypothetical protein [Candidatus Dojkabacteria bacterium]